MQHPLLMTTLVIVIVVVIMIIHILFIMTMALEKHLCDYHVIRPISFWNQQKLKEQTQKEQKIKDRRKKLVELSRPTHPISSANKRRLQALEQKKHLTLSAT